LNFRAYLQKIFQSSETRDEIFYQKKISYISSEIEQNKYNFDIFLSAYLRTGSYLSTQQANIPAAQTAGFSESGYGVAINANKLLYDGAYKLTSNNYSILKRRLADIQSLNAKEQLTLYASNIYASMYISQEELKVYKEIYMLQKNITNIIKKSYKQGKYAPIDYIDAQNDLLSIKKSLIDLNYAHVHNEYIVKYSVKSQTPQRYRLLKQDIFFKKSTLIELQKQTLHNNSAIAIESNKLKLSQTDLLAQKRRYYPSVNFFSYLGYGALNNKLYFKDINTYTSSAFFEAGLRLNIPLYNRGDIIQNKKQTLNSILVQKNVLSRKSKELLISVEKSFNTLKRLEKQQNILQEQISLTKQKMHLTKEGYIVGKLPYRDYANAIKNYLQYTIELIRVEESYQQETLALAILTGKRELYE